MEQRQVSVRRRLGRAALATVLVSAWAAMLPVRVDAGAAGSVLILEEMVIDGVDSMEGTYASSLGYTVDLVDATEWSAMDTADFDDYDAIIIGDPQCDHASEVTLAAPASNAAAWAAAVTGNVVIIGTDPVYHAGTGDAQALVERGIDFVLADTSGTGAYISTSCAYHQAPPNTPVPALDGFGSFTAIGAANLPGLNDVAIAATHPALADLTEEGLSDWSNSVHNGFDSWPTGFEVLAIARDDAGNYTTPSGVRGYPYILARGVEVLRAVNLTPAEQEHTVGEECTVEVSVVLSGEPQAGAEVTITVTDGPHAGEAGTVTTDAAGEATFSYTGSITGTDVLLATWDYAGTVLESDTVTCSFVGVATTAPPTTATTTTAPPVGPAATPQPVTPRYTG